VVFHPNHHLLTTTIEGALLHHHPCLLMDVGVAVGMIDMDRHRLASIVTVDVMSEAVDSIANAVGREVLREEGPDVGTDGTIILTNI
jgi:hypothetical protein